MLIDGVTSIPFSAKTLDSPKITDDLSAAIAGVSREKYGSTKENVEDNIRDWYNVDSVIAGVNANEQDNPMPVKKPYKPAATEDNNKADNKPKATSNDLKDALQQASTAKKPASPQQAEPDNKEVLAEDNNAKPDMKKAIQKALEEKEKEGSVGTKIETKVTEPVNEKEPVLVAAKTISKELPKQVSPSHHESNNIVRHKAETAVPKQNTYKNIDRNTLRDIIRDAARPKSHHEKVSEPKQEQKPTTNNLPQSDKENVINQPKKEIVNQDRAYLAEEVREITPEDFHNLKAIHPHEKISVKKDSKEIKPGDVVKF
jgi:hypothetical protein